MTLGDEDETGFTAFVRRYRPKLVRAIWGWTSDLYLAEDIAQEVLLVVRRYWGRYPNPEIIMFQFARQRLYRYHRLRIPAQMEPLDDRLDSDRTSLSTSQSGLDVIDDRDQIVRAMRGLPVRQREVLVLSEICDLDQRIVAQILGISESSVKTHKSRGLQNLQEIVTSGLTAAGAGAEQPVGGSAE